MRWWAKGAALVFLALPMLLLARPGQAQLTISNLGDVTIGQPGAPASLTVHGSLTAYGTLPIGAVIDWWRPSSSNLRLPDGFEICDGRMITDPTSPLRGSRTPNLVGLFTSGVAAAGDIGGTGGAAAASVDVVVQLPARTEAIPTESPSPSANHRPGLIVRGLGSSKYRFALVEQGTGPDTPNDGQHVHDLGDQATGRIRVPTLPPFFGMLKIVRIK